MRYAIALVASLILCGTAQPVVAQFELLEVMHWKFHGPVESIDERDYEYDYKAKALKTESEKGRVYNFDAAGRLKTIEGTDPYGKTTYTVGYDDKGRMRSLRRVRQTKSGKKIEEEQVCYRDDKGQITALATHEYEGFISIKLPQKIEIEVEQDRRLIRTYKIDDGPAQYQYVIEGDRLAEIHTYDGYTKPPRVSKTQRFDAKGVLQEVLNTNLAAEPKKVTSRDNFKYEFDKQGNWTEQTEHTTFGDKPSNSYTKVTRAVKYRSK